MAEKVALVSGAHEAYGLGPSLRAVGLSRSTWYYRTRTTVPVRGEVRAPGGAAEGDRRGAPGVRIPAGRGGAQGDLRPPGEP